MGVLISDISVFTFAFLSLRVVVPWSCASSPSIEGNGSRWRHFEGVDELEHGGKGALRKVSIADNDECIPGIL